MGLIEVIVLIAGAIAVATALCWTAVTVAVRRVRNDHVQRGDHARAGRV